MDAAVCDEKHKRVDEKFVTHENRLNDHGKRIDKLEQGHSEFKVEIKSLCDNIKNLTTTLRWFIGLMVGSFAAFFFYAVQQGLFK